MQELKKFNLKTNAIPMSYQNVMTFSINNKLSFVDSFPRSPEKMFYHDYADTLSTLTMPTTLILDST